MLRRGHRKHLRPNMTAEIRVGNGNIHFNTQVRCWLGIWMDSHQTFKEQHNRCMKIARAAEVRLRKLTVKYSIVSKSKSAVQGACVQAVALHGSEIRWDPNELGRRDDLHLLLNRQATSILCVLPTTPQCALMRQSARTPTPGILDSRQR